MAFHPVIDPGQTSGATGTTGVFDKTKKGADPGIFSKVLNSGKTVFTTVGSTLKKAGGALIETIEEDPLKAAGAGLGLYVGFQQLKGRLVGADQSGPSVDVGLNVAGSQGGEGGAAAGGAAAPGGDAAPGLFGVPMPLVLASAAGLLVLGLVLFSSRRR